MLDPNVRNWVMIPITFAMLLIGVLRHLVAKVRNEAAPEQRGRATMGVCSAGALRVISCALGAVPAPIALALR